MKRTPKTRYPWSAEQFYSKQLLKLVNQLGKLTLNVFDDKIRPLIVSSRMKTDADINIPMVIDLIKALSLGIFASEDIKKTASRFMLNLNQQSKSNTDSQAKAHGIDPVRSEPWLGDFMKTNINNNVKYISSIRDEYFPKIMDIINTGVRSGQSITDIRGNLVDRIGMTRNRAQFIAVDQTGSIFGQITAKRHQAMGVNSFEWVDAGDNRVRPKHRDLNGNTFSYANPPSEGLPGEPYRCRCVAMPVFADEQKQQAQPIAQEVPKETVKLDLSNFPIYLSKGTEGKNTKKMVDFINDLPDANPNTVRLYRNMGKMENILSNEIPIKVTHGKNHAVSSSYYRSNGNLASVQLIIPKLSGEDIRGQMHTILHEEMHLMDLYNRSDPLKHGNALSARHSGLIEAFNKADDSIAKDVKDLFDQFKAETKKVSDEAYARYKNSMRELDKKEGSISYRELKKEMKKLTAKRNEETDYGKRNALGGGINNFQDIYDALSGGKYSENGTVQYGHGTSYYSTTEKRLSETVANYASLSIMRPDLVDLLRKDKPELVSALDQFILTMLEKVGG